MEEPLILHVRAVEADKVPETSFASVDPYLVVSIVGSLTNERTGIIKNSTHPVWHANFHFNVIDGSFPEISIKLYDGHPSLSGDNPISQIRFDTSGLTVGRIIDNWLPMIPFRSGSQGGRTHVMVQILPEGHPPFIPFSRRIYQKSIFPEAQERRAWVGAQKTQHNLSKSQLQIQYSSMTSHMGPHIVAPQIKKSQAKTISIIRENGH